MAAKVAPPALTPSIWHPSRTRAGVEYGSRNVLADPEVREGIKRFTAWPTIPQAGVTHRGCAAARCCMKLVALCPWAIAAQAAQQRGRWKLSAAAGRCMFTRRACIPAQLCRPLGNFSPCTSSVMKGPDKGPRKWWKHGDGSLVPHPNPTQPPCTHTCTCIHTYTPTCPPTTPHHNPPTSLHTHMHTHTHIHTNIPPTTLHHTTTPQVFIKGEFVGGR